MREIGNLKPCPFCNQPAAMKQEGKWFSVACSRCSCKIGPYASPERTAEMWNMRAGLS